MDTYFDKIFIINLDRRKDRWQKMENKLKKYNIHNYQRISAIDGELCQNKIHEKHTLFCKMIQNSIDAKKQPLLKGEVGLILSTIEVLKIAIKNKYERILLLDDDILFHHDFNNQFNNIIKGVDKWKLLYLGSTYSFFKPIEIKNHIGYFPKDIERFWGTYAYAIDSSIYKEYMLLLMNSLTPLDSQPIHSILHKYYKECFMIYPNLIIADVSDMSDIRGVKYDREYYSKIYKWDLSLYDDSII